LFSSLYLEITNKARACNERLQSPTNFARSANPRSGPQALEATGHFRDGNSGLLVVRAFLIALAISCGIASSAAPQKPKANQQDQQFQVEQRGSEKSDETGMVVQAQAWWRTLGQAGNDHRG